MISEEIESFDLKCEELIFLKPSVKFVEISFQK